MLPILRGSRDTSDLGPKLESPGPCGSVFAGGDVLAAERKEVVDLIMSRGEPLCRDRDGPAVTLARTRCRRV
jgi:hypothetical protein